MPEHPPTNTPPAPAPGIYTRLIMSTVYPVWVHGICHPLAWGVSNAWLRRSYRTWPGQVHLTIGPGNGRFLRHLSPGVRVLHLMDFAENCLSMGERAARRRALTPQIHFQDVLERWRDLPDASVDSIDCVMVMHCLPGTGLAEKASLFAEAHRVLRPGGVFFGATILASGPGVRVNGFARRLMAAYIAKGWFDNRGDTATGLERELRTHFSDADISVQGCTGVWTAVKR